MKFIRKRNRNRRRTLLWWVECITKAILLTALILVLSAMVCICMNAISTLSEQELHEIISPADNAEQEEPEILERTVTVETSATELPEPIVRPTELVEAKVLPPEAPERLERYADVTISAAERDELASIIYLEAGNQSAEGQQAVAEVILNRVVHPAFPDTVYGVLHSGEGTSVPQFSTITALASAEPTQEQYDAIDAALYGESILPLDVVFFSQSGENDRVWGTIGDHVFCREYLWGE